MSRSDGGDPDRRGPRPRAECIVCHRNIAVTFGPKGSGLYLWRPHNIRPGKRCIGSGKDAGYSAVLR